jgi:hypothetical protein
MRRFIITALALLLAGGGVAAYFIIDHNNDVAHAKAVRKARAKARTERIDRAYQANLRRWRADDAEWTRKNDAYADCLKATASAFGAADEVQGVIGTGGSRDEYLEPIQDLGTEIAGAGRMLDENYDCLTVLAKLGKAQDQWTDATNIWLEWINGDAYRYADNPGDLPMDKHFTKGSGYVFDAETALRRMKPGRPPVKPERGGSYEPPTTLDI